MTEVTYFVALPFVAADDGIAAGEPTECFNPNAAVMRAEPSKPNEEVLVVPAPEVVTGDVVAPMPPLIAIAKKKRRGKISAKVPKAAKAPRLPSKDKAARKTVKKAAKKSKTKSAVKKKSTKEVTKKAKKPTRRGVTKKKTKRG